MIEARALWMTAPGQSELRNESLPMPGPGELRVRTLYSALSRGTERLVYQGRVPASEYTRMRAPFQVGAFPFPIKYGYANVGRVELGSLEGREVFCLYPHQTRYQVAAASVIPLPPGVPAARAVLAANMETALNAVWDAELGAGDRVCVVGAGVVGALCAYLAAQHPGTEVHVVDPDPSRTPIVERLGASVQAAGEYDVVLHASGSPAGLTTALALAGQEARVVELSWYGDQSVSLPLGEAFHAKRLTLRSSQVGQLPPSRVARWSHTRRLALALSLLTDPALDVLFGDDIPFAALPRALAAAFAGSALCTRIVYPSPSVEEPPA